MLVILGMVVLNVLDFIVFIYRVLVSVHVLNTRLADVSVKFSQAEFVDHFWFCNWLLFVKDFLPSFSANILVTNRILLYALWPLKHRWYSWPARILLHLKSSLSETFVLLNCQLFAISFHTVITRIWIAFLFDLGFRAIIGDCNLLIEFAKALLWFT